MSRKADEGTVPHRLKFEIREIVTLVVMEGEQLQPGFRESDGSNFRLIPFMHAPGGQGQFALSCRLVIDRETNRIGGIAIQSNHPIGLGLCVHRVIAPLAIGRPADV